MVCGEEGCDGITEVIRPKHPPHRSLAGLPTGTMRCKGADIIRALWQAIFAFERRFSRFIPDSELSSFNQAAGLRTPISPEFRSILVAARDYGELTDGLSNPFILPALQRAGYTKSRVAAYQDDPVHDYSKLSVVSVDHLEIGDTWATIPYGTAIDLGGCGKGYLGDLVADTLVPDWVSGFWFSFGGDVVGEGGNETGQAWQVALPDSPQAMQTTGERFAVATSATTVIGGTSWHHLIDPRTGKPSTSDLHMVSLLAPRGIQADVLASCAIIIGSVQAVPFLKSRGVLAAYAQGTAGVTQFGTAIVTPDPAVKEVLHA